jgi:hypothetical protein
MALNGREKDYDHLDAVTIQSRKVNCENMI